jgi:type IV fimbrial biogenesis protein FimT
MHMNKGFSVVELMVTVVIAAILVAYVVPGFVTLFERNNVATTSNELLGALLYARSEAVRIEGNVTFTPEADGWLVTSLGSNIVDQNVDNSKVTLSENIANNVVTYNSRGRADITLGDNIEVLFNGTVKSRVCLSLTGRPYIKMADEGNCP